MMKREQIRNNDKKLEILLNSIEVPQKEEYEWKILKNRLFARMDDFAASDKKMRVDSLFSKYFINLKYKSAFFFAGAAIVILSLIMTPTDFISRENRTAGIKVLHSIGEVTLVNNDKHVSADSLRLKKTPLRNGMVFQTGDTAAAIIQIDSGSALKLFRNSRLTVAGADYSHLVFHLDRGGVLSIIGKKQKESYFAITTPNAMCRVTGTVFHVKFDGKHNRETPPRTILTVFEGSVEMTDIEKNTVKTALSGQQLTLEGNNLADSSTPKENDDIIRSISLTRKMLDISNSDRSSEGLLEVLSTPSGAKVTINGNIEGRTPLITKKPDEKYNIILSMNNFIDWQTEVNVKAGILNNISAKLRPYKSSYFEDNHEPVLVENPKYIEALIQITSGGYKKGIEALNRLLDDPLLTTEQLGLIRGKISSCYQSMGDFPKSLEHIEKRYAEMSDGKQKSLLLWETANIKAASLGRYKDALWDIEEYIEKYPDGSWIESAWIKKAEICRLLGQTEKAAQAYYTHYLMFKESPEAPLSLFKTGLLFHRELNRYDKAVELYNNLLRNYPQSPVSETALYHKALCHINLKNFIKAREALESYNKLYPDGLWKSPSFRQLSILSN